MTRERICEWANCHATGITVTMNYRPGLERPAFCSPLHAALWLIRREHSVADAETVERLFQKPPTRGIAP